MKCTLFENIRSTNTPIVMSVQNVLARVKTGGNQREFIERLREMSEEDYRKNKSNLPAVCFNGIFSARNKESIVEGSGLMVLDYDHIKNIDNLKALLKKKPYIYAIFLSPSGGGLKALARIPKTTSDEEFKDYFNAIRKEFKTLDKSGSDISRACFVSYDPDIYINPNATIWDKKASDKESYKIDANQWKSINHALRKIEDAVDGERHMVRTKIGYLFGGWVGSGRLQYDEAISLLEGAIRKNTENFDDAMRGVRIQVNEGMSRPVDFSEEKRIMNMKVGRGRMYKHMSEVYDEVMDFYRNGYQRGVEVGYESLNPGMSLLKGSTSVSFGAPRSGKSQIIHQFAVNISDKYGWKWAIFTPETGNIPQIYGELASVRAGQSFIGEYQMDEDKAREVLDWVKNHFVVIDNEGKEFDGETFYTQVEAIEREYGIKIDGTIIDPLNNLDVDLNAFGGREDKAVAKNYDIMMADARQNDRHNHAVTHIVKQELRTNKDGVSYYPPAAPQQIMGGQQSYRKGMLMWQVYRPLDTNDEPLLNNEGIPYDENETHIIVHKAKPKGVAVIGKYPVYYDFKANSYYEKDRFDEQTPRQPGEEHGKVIGGVPVKSGVRQGYVPYADVDIDPELLQSEWEKEMGDDSEQTEMDL